jgi:dTMP kinase
MKQGAYVIEVEGTDGAGKTTGLKYLVEQLRSKGYKVLETREVGSPLIPVCIQMRETVLSPDSGLNGSQMEVVFAAMRVLNQAYYRKISSEYDFIISDRGWFSHLAYTDHNVDVEFTNKLYMDIMQNITFLPDAVLYFDVNTETALQRRVKRGGAMDVIEMKGVEYQDKVRDSFKKYLNLAPKNMICNIVDANQSIEGVREQLDIFVGFFPSPQNIFS